MPQDSSKKLPQPVLKGNTSLEECISRRRSERFFSDKDLTKQQVGQILWSAQGITAEKNALRAAPSAGACYPMEIYALTKEGLFHYAPQAHSTEHLSTTDLRPKLARASFNQMFIEKAPLTIVLTAVYERITGRYGNRGIRYSDMEAGHIGENVHLQAVALGLVSVPVGAFDDDSVSRVLNLPKDHVPLYIIPVGYGSEDK